MRSRRVWLIIRHSQISPNLVICFPQQCVVGPEMNANYVTKFNLPQSLACACLLFGNEISNHRLQANIILSSTDPRAAHSFLNLTLFSLDGPANLFSACPARLLLAIFSCCRCWFRYPKFLCAFLMRPFSRRATHLQMFSSPSWPMNYEWGHLTASDHLSSPCQLIFQPNNQLPSQPPTYQSTSLASQPAS